MATGEPPDIKLEDNAPHEYLLGGVEISPCMYYLHLYLRYSSFISGCAGAKVFQSWPADIRICSFLLRRGECNFSVLPGSNN